jgi:hypothetical protein
MKKLLIILTLGVLAICGCATKSRHVDLAGAYSSGGSLAIGSVEIQSAPEGTESAMVSYEDCAAWFRDVKEHRIRILLTGTNSVVSADSIVKDICNAFITVANTNGVSAVK